MVVNRALLIDANYMLNRCLHVKDLASLQDSKGRLTGGVYGVLNTLNVALSRAPGTTKVVAVFDGGRSRRRLALFPPDPETKTGYKATRGILPDMTPEEVAEKKQMMAAIESSTEILVKILYAAGVHVVRWPEREADDVIALLSRNLTGFDQIVVASDDWDYAQLVTERVCVYRPLSDYFLSMHNFIEKVGVPVDWATVKKGCEGDSSDNIPGVRGVGPKTVAAAVEGYAASVIPDFNMDWYKAHQYLCRPKSLEPFFAFCREHKSKKVQKIAESQDTLLRNLQLVDLSLEEFPPDHVQFLLQNVHTPLEFQEMEVAHQLGDLEINSILENYSNWAQPFRVLS